MCMISENCIKHEYTAAASWDVCICEELFGKRNGQILTRMPLIGLKRSFSPAAAKDGLKINH